MAKAPFVIVAAFFVQIVLATKRPSSLSVKLLWTLILGPKSFMVQTILIQLILSIMVFAAQQYFIGTVILL
jgi:hypothetical protein